MDIDKIKRRAESLAAGVGLWAKGVSPGLIEHVITVGLLDGLQMAETERVAKDMASGFAKLHPVDGDLLIYTTDPDNPPDVGTVERFQEQLRANGATVVVACVDPSEKLELSDGAEPESTEA